MKIALGEDGTLTQPPPKKHKPKHDGDDHPGHGGHGGHDDHGPGPTPFGETPQSYGPDGRRN
jgi:hypothetical protein